MKSNDIVGEQQGGVPIIIQNQQTKMLTMQIDQWGFSQQMNNWDQSWKKSLPKH